MNECASALSSSCIVLCANIFVVMIMITITIMIITTIIVIITTLRSVFHHLLSPQSNGLFRAGLANSGTMISGLADRYPSACRHDRQGSVSIFISIVIIIGYLSSIKSINYNNHQVHVPRGGGRKRERVRNSSELPSKGRYLGTGNGDFPFFDVFFLRQKIDQ